jgi:hypothetical protein
LENEKEKPISKQVIPEEKVNRDDVLKITRISSVAKAREVLKIMYEQHARNPRTVWACDTEVADIDLKEVGEKLCCGCSLQILLGIPG